VEAAPEDVALRLHFAEVLADAGDRDEAVRQAAVVLQSDPANAAAVSVIAGSSAGEDRPSSLSGSDRAEELRGLEAELSGVIPPMFTDAGLDGESRGYDVEAAGVRLSDVAGMDRVKERLEAAFLAPLRNPELTRLSGRSLRGGLLLYGPPGCGKTFIARALAGEMGAQFIVVSLADVLDMYIGQSERNLHDIFELARRASPCVVFLDEIDALGHKRSQMRNSAARGTVNQLLTEMDGVADSNDGVYVVGATNHRGMSTSRCDGRAASIGCCSCYGPTTWLARRCFDFICAIDRSRRSTCASSPPQPTDTPRRTSPTSAKAQPNRRSSTRHVQARRG
jgi:SpoVK/Ycf46/Vps4 family AAA+-type ATPase